MPSIEYDLQYLKIGIGTLENYFHTRKLFWPIHAGSPTGEPAFPRLTLGSLLLSLKRVQARDLTPQQRRELRSFEFDLQQAQKKRQVAWEQKIEHEFSSRARQWRFYLNELNRDLEKHTEYYPNEVRLRVLLELLLENKPSLDDKHLNAMDSFLQTFFLPGDFIWDIDLVSGFPEDTYWYLWGVPV